MRYDANFDGRRGKPIIAILLVQFNVINRVDLNSLKKHKSLKKSRRLGK